MAQHDYDLANQNGAAFRADLNAALAAIQSLNSGATEPAATVAYMPWADTSAGLWKVRNAADSAWVSVMSLTASRVDTAAGTSYDNTSSGLAATNLKDAIDEIVSTGAFEKATTAQAEAGTDDEAYMTPLKTKQQADALIPLQTQTVWNTGTDTTESRISSAKLDAKILNKFNVTGSAPLYACRAWVNFNGAGAVAIRASGNVSSITDNGIGDYTVNFITPIQDADYGVSSNAGENNSDSAYSVGLRTVAASLVRLRVRSAGNNPTDVDTVTAIISR